MMMDMASVLWQMNASNPGGKVSCVIQLWNDRDGSLEFAEVTSLEINIDSSIFKPKIKVREKDGIFMISDERLWVDLKFEGCLGEALRKWLSERMIEGIEPRIDSLRVLSNEELRSFEREGAECPY